MPTLAGKKHVSINFFAHRLRLFHLSTENVPAQSVRNGHQSAYSRADTLNNKVNKKPKAFLKRENNNNNSSGYIK